MAFPLLLFAALKTVGTAVNFIGQRKQAGYEERQGEMERDLFGKNADLAEAQATDAEARGHEAELRQRLRIRLLTGAQNSSFAGQGVNVGVGSPQQVMGSDRSIGEMDALAIRENAHREAMGFTKQAEIFRTQGNLAYTAGRNRAKADRWASVGTLANYAGDMFSLYKGIKT